MEQADFEALMSLAKPVHLKFRGTTRRPQPAPKYRATAILASRSFNFLRCPMDRLS